MVRFWLSMAAWPVGIGLAVHYEMVFPAALAVFLAWAIFSDYRPPVHVGQ